MLLMLLAPAANAVTKHLSMVGENGQPMASTTITITFPDGTKEEEKTDDKGILNHAIELMLQNNYVDQLRLRRMKKRKLKLKDSILRLESMVIPDIDA